MEYSRNNAFTVKDLQFVLNGGNFWGSLTNKIGTFSAYFSIHFFFCTCLRLRRLGTNSNTS